MNISRAALFLFFVLTLAVAQFRGTEALAHPTYFTSQGCSDCHSAPVVATCNGCHHHGPVALKGVTNKTSYAPKETVSVTITGGSKSGWIGAKLYDQNGVELARPTGNDSGMGWSATYPVTLTAPAPDAAGTYTWKVAWYGNQYDTSSLGSNWTPDATNPNHGEVRVSINSFKVVVPDTTAPTVTFTVPAADSGYSKSRKIPVTLTADDGAGSGVAGYLITKNDPTPPLATVSGWKTTAPTSYTVTADGSYDLYGWAKDKAGNVSLAVPKQTVIVDSTPPKVTVFTLSNPVSGLTVNGITLTATDNLGAGNLAGYLITESSAKPTADAAGWSDTAPTSYTVATTGGARTLYAWAKDAAGNVSAAKTAKVTIPNTSISGKVTDGSTGKPLAKVVVSVYNAATGILVKSAKTASSGTYSVTALATGTTYKVLFDGSALAQGYARRFYNGTMVGFNTATPVIIQSTAVAGVNAALVPGGSISGTVNDGSKGIAGIKASAYTTYGVPVFGATATTKADGTYIITGLPAGDYRAQFDGGSAYAVGYNGNTSVLDGTNPITVSAGSSASAGVATLSSASIASIFGQATDAATSAAIPNVTVSAYTDSGNFVKSVQSDAGGNYRIDGLTDGTNYKVFFDGASMGYSRMFSSGELFDITAAASVAAPQAAANGALAAGGSISGQATDSATSAPLAGIRVSAYATGDVAVFGAGQITDDDGNYTINGLPLAGNDYKIQFDGSPDYVITFFGGADLGSAAPVTDSAGAVVSGTDAALTH
jgi:hypothetical protein